MASIAGGCVFHGNVAAIDSFKDGVLQRFVHVELGNQLVFTSVEGEELYRENLAQFGIIFVFDLTVELSSFDGAVCVTVVCFDDEAPQGGDRAIRTVKTDYFAQEEW